MKVKFLIIRLSSIGDIVLTTPVIRCLKQQVEEAEVHYLVKERFFPVIAANPYIDKIHVYRGSLRQTIRELKEEDFHYIIDLHHSLRSKLIKFRLRVLALTFRKLNFRKWILVRFHRNCLPDIHIVDRYLETVRLFDVRNDGKGLDYYIPPGEEVAPGILPDSFKQGYIVFVIGAMHATKRLTTGKITAICREISAPVILLGGPGEKDEGEHIAIAAGPHVFNGCGAYSINQSASLLKQARLVITHDTGLMHIAAAFHKKILSIWGNTVPAFGMYPYLPDPASRMFEINGLPCRPCSRIGYSRCPKRHFKCILQISDQEVAGEANRLFAMP
jgi:ADP-heptose:LPS heptosyltransferase